jgi:hypothetical protein
VAVAAVLVAAGVVFLRVQRDREWAHGGDRLTVDVEVALATQDTFDDVVVRLGVPPGKTNRDISAEQSVVVRIRWSGSKHSHGWFDLIALDKRSRPARPLTAEGGWNSAGAQGSGWGSAYAALAEHYDWLAGTAEVDQADASGVTVHRSAPSRTASVSAPAATAGTATAWFRCGGDGTIPLTDAGREVAVALVYMDDGEVRWARRIYG